MEIILGFGPILFSGAVAGALASYFAPTVIRQLQANFHHKKIDELYATYQNEPDKLEKNSPEVLKFFKDEKWRECECSCCGWLRRQEAKRNKKNIKEASS